MKIFTKVTIALCVLSSFLSSGIQAAATPVPVIPMTSSTMESVESAVLINRLYEIKSMDISKLKHAQKKQLRQEVKSIKTKLKVLSGGVYLSAGAIIIIILILILLV